MITTSRKNTAGNRCFKEPKKKKAALRISIIALFGFIAAIFIATPLDEIIIIGIIGGAYGGFVGGVFFSYGGLLIIISLTLIVTIMCYMIKKNYSKKDIKRY